MKKAVLTFILIVTALAVNSQGRYTNPVIRGDVADPSAIRIDDTFYATGTSSEWAPFYPVFTSRDLVNWDHTGHIFKNKPEWTVSSFWAPELFYHNGRVFCYYTARNKTNNISCIGVASAGSPTDEFTDHGLLVEWGSEAIDAFVFDDDGQLYISWKAYGLDDRHIELVASRLSDDGLRLEGEPFTLLVDDEDIGMEGQYHFRNGDWYYIVYAAHGCCGPESDYDVYVARFRSYAGPYEKFGGNPVLHGGQGDIMSCGHGTAVTLPDGRMFYMCHAYFNGERFFMGRQPILQEMFITDDGWIQFATGSLSLVDQPVPFCGTIQRPVGDFFDDFVSPELKADWSWNYPFSDAEIKVGEGELNLSGSMTGQSLYGTALCIRPVCPSYEYETMITGDNPSFQGLTIYGDDRNFVALGTQDGQVVIKTVRGGQETSVRQTITGATHLKIRVHGGRTFSFYAGNGAEQWTRLNAGTDDAGDFVRWDRIARPGLIHIGDVDHPAVFSYFRLTNLQE